MPKKYLESLKDVFEKNSDSAYADAMAKYMLNQFPFYGIKSPERKRICRDFLKETIIMEKSELFSLIYTLWQLPQREYQYFALDILEKNMKRLEDGDIKFLEALVISKSWWDTVDMIASKLIGTYFLKFPGQVNLTKIWIESSNLWLQRSALLFQLKYKNQTDQELLFTYIKQMAGSREFFIRKAIGWALREYAYTNSQDVIKFIDENKEILSPLSKREALKRLVKK